MNGQMLVEQVRERKHTELERLGSDKQLLAVTGADLAAGPILERIALSLDGLRTAVSGWAEETSVDAAREAFEDAAGGLEDEYDRVVAQLDAEPAGDPPTPVGTVRSFERPETRVAAALVGHGLVLDGTLLQTVSFFVNEADEARADLARDLRTGVNRRIESGVTALDVLCGDDADWDRAQAAATDVVEAAYHEYVETLGELGIDPKPVC